MEDLPADLQKFLENHPFLQLADSKKIKCTLNGHEFPCNLAEVENFTKGKKYQKLSATAEFSYSQYEPHVVPSTKKPNQLFCKLTLKHLNRLPHHVLRHVNGKRFKKALAQYKECVKQGTQFVPIQLLQKRPQEQDWEGERGRNARRGNSETLEPASSDEQRSDSEDSMSDLYPCQYYSYLYCFFSTENEGMVEEKEDDDFLTDEDEEDEMEVDKKAPQKRKKVQANGFQKKFKNQNWKRKGLKTCGKAKNSK
ncbi:surfeit locus protein 2 [Aplochiton taeniatus]